MTIQTVMHNHCMLQKNCLCQYTYRSINCSRVSSSPIPWSLHSLSWISSVVVSPSVLVNHGMLGWVQQGASTPTHCCPSHRGIIGKKCLWMTSSIVASLTVVVSANVRRNLSSTIRIAEDMSKYNMNFLKTLQLHKSRCVLALQYHTWWMPHQHSLD